jgi:hypothetical protein
MGYVSDIIQFWLQLTACPLTTSDAYPLSFDGFVTTLPLAQENICERICICTPVLVGYLQPCITTDSLPTNRALTFTQPNVEHGFSKVGQPKRCFDWKSQSWGFCMSAFTMEFRGCTQPACASAEVADDVASLSATDVGTKLDWLKPWFLLLFFMCAAPKSLQYIVPSTGGN